MPSRTSTVACWRGVSKQRFWSSWKDRALAAASPAPLSPLAPSRKTARWRKHVPAWADHPGCGNLHRAVELDLRLAQLGLVRISGLFLQRALDEPVRLA